MLKFLVVRSRYFPDQTLGNLFLINDENQVLFQCRTLELPYRRNQRNISSIPTGMYEIVLEYSPKYGMAWELKNVPNRSEVKIHHGNYHQEIRGCILVGDYHMDINNDDTLDIRNSRRTRNRMESVLREKGITKTNITIIEI